MAVWLLSFLLASMNATARAQSRSPQHFLLDGRVLRSSIFQSKLEQGQAPVEFNNDLGFSSDWSSELRALGKIPPGNRLRYFLTPWLGINGGYIYSGLKIVIDDPSGFFRLQSNNIFFGATLGF